MKVSGIFLFVTVLVALSSCDYFGIRDVRKGKNGDEAAIKARNDSIHTADSLRNLIEEQQKIEDAIIDSVKKVTEELNLTENSLKFKIIIGSYTKLPNAEQLRDRFRSKGYDPKIITSEKEKTYMVYIAEFSDYETARRRLKGFRSGPAPHAWIYTLP